MSKNIEEFDYREPEPPEQYLPFLAGAAATYEVVLTRLEKMQAGLDEVMSIYMADELHEHKDRINELHALYTFASHLKASLEDPYFELIDDAKINLDTYLKEVE